MSPSVGDGCRAPTSYELGMSANPWLSQQQEPVEEGPAPVVEAVAPRAWALGVVSPDVPEPVGAVGTVAVRGARRWLVGAHGGAGVSTLARLLEWGDAERSWPVPAVPGEVLEVWVVARTHGAGITAAQDAAVAWASGRMPGVELGGIVWVPDAPKKLSRVLREQKVHVSGAFPTSVTLPWVEGWREEPAGQLPAAPGNVRRALKPLVAKRKDDK